MEKYNFRLWNSEAENIEDWGQINPKAIKEFLNELEIDINKLEDILKLIPVLQVEGNRYYDINYFYKKILLRTGNINKDYLSKICNEINSNIIIKSENVKYSEQSNKTYIRNYILVPANVIVYILKRYKSNWSLYYHDFEMYIEYRYDETYDKVHFIEIDFSKLKQNAVKYIESIYLILMFCRNENINRNIFAFNKDRMTIQPIDYYTE